MADAMWIRRSSTEIEQRKRRQRFSPVGALGITTFIMLLVWLLPRHSGSTHWKAFALTFLTCFVLLYVSHVLVGRYLIPLPGPSYGPPTALILNMICPLCRTTQPDTDSHTCQCGGQLEPLDHWRWVEDDKAKGPSTPAI